MNGSIASAGSPWRGFLAAAAGSFLLAQLALAALMIVVDPFGVGPLGTSANPRLMDSSQRAMIPQIVRSHRFDSAVVGSSVVALLEPRVLDREVGGRFANLGMIGGRPAEVERAARLFLRETPMARTLVVGLDPNWCSPKPMPETGKVWFPATFYDANPWNDAGETMSLRAFEIAARKVAAMAGLTQPRLRQDGYEVYSMDERRYDPVLARRLIAEQGADARKAAADEAGQAGPFDFPELARLQRILADTPRDARTLVAFMPQHAGFQPPPGSRSERRIAACKDRIAAMATAARAAFADFYLLSPMTSADENFWDRVHTRAAVADMVAEALGRVRSGKASDADNGSWRIRVLPPS